MKVKIDNQYTNNSSALQLKKNVEQKLSDLDFSKYGISNFICTLSFNCTTDSLKNAIPLGDNRKYIIFRNQPRQHMYNYEFEASLSKIRLRLQQEQVPSEFSNVKFEIDFSGVESQPTTEKDDFQSEYDKEMEQRIAMFVPQEPEQRLDQMFLEQKQRDEIEEALTIIKCRDIIYQKWGYEKVDPHARAILSFYGPPGTGKTMGAHAIASYLGKKVLCINYSDIESKWAGESPKNLLAAFTAAKRNDAVLFFDEADSFLGKRIGNVQTGHDQSINSLRSQMLILLEKFEGVVILATNLVTNYDSAFQTRILKHLKFDLPNEDARAAIYKKQIELLSLPVEKPFSDEEYQSMAALCDGFSGRDIRNAVFDTLLAGAKDNITYFTGEYFLTSINKRVESYKKLKEEEEAKKKDKENKIKNALLTQAEKQYRKALLDVAICAAWSDNFVDPTEKTIIEETSKMFGLETPNLESKEEIPNLTSVCEKFEESQAKKEALDIACKVIAIDGKIMPEEEAFLRQLCSALKVENASYEKAIEYIKRLVGVNVLLKNIL